MNKASPSQTNPKNDEDNDDSFPKSFDSDSFPPHSGQEIDQSSLLGNQAYTKLNYNSTIKMRTNQEICLKVILI